MDRSNRRAPLRFLASWLSSLLFVCFSLNAAPLTAQQSSQSADKSAIIPFSYGPHNHCWIIVQARINGYPPLPFLVDTGSWEPLVIDTSVARQLGLNDERTVTDNSGRGSTKAVDLQSFVIVGTDPGHEIDSADASAVVEDIPQFLRDARPKAGGPGIAGIIGCPLLADYLKYVEIDFLDKKLIATWPPPTQIPAHAAIVPLHRSSGVERYLIQISDGKQSAPFIFDTGSGASAIVPPTFVTPADGAASFKDVYTLYYGYVVATDRLQISGLQIGDGITLHALTVNLAASSDRSAPPSPLLGLECLTAYDIRLDFTRNEMILSPLARGPQPSSDESMGEVPAGLPNPTFGAEFVRPPGGVLAASYVMPGSLAAKAGLQNGDRIVALGGEETASMSAVRMSHLLNQTAVEMSVRRTEGNRTAEYTLKITQP